MEGNNLAPLIEALDNDIDDLEEALSPLLKASLPEHASKLPVLNKAQLYILITYAIESMIFCTLTGALVLQESSQTNDCSVLTAEWRQCKRASHLPRAD